MKVPRLREPYPAGRRAFLRLGCNLFSAGVTTAVLGPLYAWRIEPGWIQVTRPKITLQKLPAALEGFSIVQISDFHLGPDVKIEHVRHAVALANGMHPDLIALTGDYVSESADYIAPCAGELALLQARYGVYAVLGNRDQLTDADRVAYGLTQAGIVVLRDEARAISIGDIRLWLVGLDDTGYTAFNGHLPGRARGPLQEKVAILAELLARIPDTEPRLLLIHNPDLNELFQGMHLDLALCGHTHGGQVRLPLVGALFVPSLFGRKYADGLVQGPASPVYVNRGLGVVPPPVRLNCRPKITLMRLSRG